MTTDGDEDRRTLPLRCRIGVHRFRRQHVMGALYQWVCENCGRKWNP